jgi:Zn-dependent metalloprotease
MTNKSDGSTASYYQLPPGCTELQDLISYRNMNAQDGEILRAIYRKGRASHSDELRDAKKVLFYAQAEVKRLEALATVKQHFTIEPASQIDDESPRMQAIAQNGNDGAAYSEIDRLRAAEAFNADIAVPQREPCQPRHRCLACGLGHSTHRCGADT